MATPRRRSSRLRGLSPQKSNEVSNKHLTVLDEDEEVYLAKSHHSPLIASPIITKPAPVTSHTPAVHAVKTPTTAGRLRPSPEEMHPSRYQNTATKAASGKRLGIVNAQLYEASSQSCEKDDQVAELRSPHLSAKSSPVRQSFASPGFQFRYRQSTDMSSEAQRMMDEIREQAARIRDGLTTERQEQMRKEDQAENIFNRKMATPKGKMGRFSDVHMDQFKNMNSIANHASAFRADALKSSTNTAKAASKDNNNAFDTSSAVFQGTKVPVNSTKSLKRTISKAELDKPELKTTRATQASSSGHSDSDDMMSPSKRVKQNHETATGPRDVTRIVTSVFSNTNVPRLKSDASNIPCTANVITPSKLPIARSASVKSLKTTTSAAPQLTPSRSIKPAATPNTTTRMISYTEGSKKYTASLAQKFTKVKSILRQPNIRFSDDAEKIVAGTHLSTPRGTQAANTTTSLAPVPDHNLTPGTPSWRKEKHVNFSPSAANPADRSLIGTPTTPSPLKIPGSFPLTYPALTADTVLAPGTPTHVPLGISRASVAGTPRDFTFRADQTISFGAHPGSAPTIRRVRASDTAAFVGLSGTNAASKIGFEQLPHVPHGLSNKKRKRNSADVDDREEVHDDKENLEAEASDLEQRGSPAKKAKLAPRPTAPVGAVAKAKAASQGGGGAASKIPKRKGGSVLSLSRLNALAKPKERR